MMLSLTSYINGNSTTYKRMRSIVVPCELELANPTGATVFSASVSTTMAVTLVERARDWSLNRSLPRTIPCLLTLDQSACGLARRRQVYELICQREGSLLIDMISFRSSNDIVKVYSRYCLCQRFIRHMHRVFSRRYSNQSVEPPHLKPVTAMYSRLLFQSGCSFLLPTTP